jgi:hypothetical protein
MTRSNRRIEHEFTPPSRWIGYITVMVIVIGVLVLLYVLGQGDRGRRAAAEEVKLGSSAEEAQAVIGSVPARCPTGSLAHLEGSFPEGWSPPSVFGGVEWLQEVTRERLVFALGSSAPVCEGAANQSEIGLDSVGAVIWTVAEVGRTPLRLPPWMTPDEVAGRGNDPVPNPE